MARYQLAVVDLDAVDANPTVKAWWDATGAGAGVLIRRTVHVEQHQAIEDEEVSRESAPGGDGTTFLIARRFLENPSLARLNEDRGSAVWNFHLRRTGITDEVANRKGIEWLKAQPDKDAVAAPPPPPNLTRGAEA